MRQRSRRSAGRAGRLGAAPHRGGNVGAAHHVDRSLNRGRPPPVSRRRALPASQAERIGEPRKHECIDAGVSCANSCRLSTPTKRTSGKRRPSRSRAGPIPANDLASRRSRFRNASMFFSTETRPTYRTRGRRARLPTATPGPEAGTRPDPLTRPASDVGDVPSRPVRARPRR